MKQIRVLLADDHHIVRDGIKSLIESLEGIVVVGEASDGVEALEKVKSLSPDILLVDISMPLMNGIQTAEAVARQYKNTKSLVLSMHDNEDYVLQSLEAGAMGYLLKDTTKDEMQKAIRAVANGEKYFSNPVSGIIADAYLQGRKKTIFPKNDRMVKLSVKEKGILKFLVEGLSSREMADKLGLSVRTVDNHRFNMMKRLQVKNAVELVRLAIEEKIV
ncbi:MAG: response regulator transcription factor [Bacteroidota bacterium]